MTTYLLPFTCPQCGKAAAKPVSAVNRAERDGFVIYCSRVCSGLARRKNKTKAQKIAEKKLYDANRRIELAEEIKTAKAEYYRTHHDRAKEKATRQCRMPQHIEYCRRPAYRAWKAEYDLNRRAAVYGEYAEAYKLLLAVDREVNSRMSDTDVRAANGILNKRQQRKRAYV